MKIMAPSYYNSFSCIADKCRHSCCIGWEIDVDSDTYEYYNTVPGDFGCRLRREISDEDLLCFRLTDEDRCPFLNDNNLCDIIINLGENALCDICREHPRFRNFYSDRTEVGLGLCCEAATELILNFKDKTEFVVIEQDDETHSPTKEEQHFFDIRNGIFEIIQNRSLTINERINLLINNYDLELPDYTIAEWSDIFLEFEHLDDAWEDKLYLLKDLSNVDESIFDNDKWSIAFEQLLVYFIFRHLEGCLHDGMLSERIAFAIVSLNVIKLLCMLSYKKNGALTIKDLADIARCYSAEIEYSEENTEALLDKLKIRRK